MKPRITLDAEKLNEAISRSGIKKTHIAKIMKITPQQLYNKLNRKCSFSGCEINVLRELLRLPDPLTIEIFFEGKVTSYETLNMGGSVASCSEKEASNER